MDYCRESVLQTIVGCTPTIVERACHIINKKDGPKRTGGHLCVMEPYGPPILLMPVGRVDDENAEKYYEFCQEKAARLWFHPRHVFSRQSRNEAKQQYAGAIRVRCGEMKLILSFSGLPEEWDENCMVALAEYIGATLCGHGRRVRRFKDTDFRVFLAGIRLL